MFLASLPSDINCVQIPTSLYMRGVFCLELCSYYERDVCFIGLIEVSLTELSWERYKSEADLA